MEIYRGLGVQLQLNQHSPTSLVRGTQVLNGTIARVDEIEQSIEISVQTFGLASNTPVVVYGWELSDLKLVPPSSSSSSSFPSINGNLSFGTSGSSIGRGGGGGGSTPGIGSGTNSSMLLPLPQPPSQSLHQMDLLSTLNAAAHKKQKPQFQYPAAMNLHAETQTTSDFPTSLFPPSRHSEGSAANLPPPPVLPTPNPTPFVGTPQQVKQQDQQQKYFNPSASDTSPLPRNINSNVINNSSSSNSTKKKKKRQQDWNDVVVDKDSEFDFEKNLNLFNKQQVYGQIRNPKQ